MVEILKVIPESIAAEMDLTVGDKILTINGQPIRDYIDYQYETAETYITMKIEKINGEIWELEIERKPGEELGIVFKDIIFEQLKLCHNNCLFCFVKQQPVGLRESLLLKDDDYRFSFLQGSFITLTNLSEEEFGRILRLRLSPLNISVHTTNPQLRIEMMKNPAAGKILEQLKMLAEAGIKFNTQIVLCPGLNDGTELDRTISDLLSLYPALISIGIVPVGLTKYREKLDKLTSYDQLKAKQVLKQIKEWQQHGKEIADENIIFAADEFYFLAGEKIPEYKEYNGFPQLENGIGLTRLLWHEFDQFKTKLPAKVPPQTLTIVTGILGEKALKPVVTRLNKIAGLKVRIVPIKNKFFGPMVTVTGLLTGSDIIKGLKLQEGLSAKIILPGIVLNDQGKFLDDLVIDDIKSEFPDKEFFLCNRIEDVMEVIDDG